MAQYICDKCNNELFKIFDCSQDVLAMVCTKCGNTYSATFDIGNDFDRMTTKKQNGK